MGGRIVFSWVGVCNWKMVEIHALWLELFRFLPNTYPLIVYGGLGIARRLLGSVFRFSPLSIMETMACPARIHNHGFI